MKEVLICAYWFNDTSQKTLQCGDQEVIDIKRSITGNYWNPRCNEAEIASWFKNPYLDSECKKMSTYIRKFETTTVLHKKNVLEISLSR